jgi:AMME syndrome candidate gene 1 protein
VPETIESLIRKAGYEGRITKDLLESITLTRYQSTKASITYEEYCADRD